LKVEGYSDAEILKSLRITPEQLAQLEETLYSEHSFEVASESPDRTFARYRIDQRRNIKALDGLIEELDSNTQYNALVGAIRLRSDITDKIIKMGQELGVTKRAPSETRHSGSVDLVSKLSTPDLRDTIKQLGVSLQDMVNRHGGGERKFHELPEESIYYGEAANVIDVQGAVVSDSKSEAATPPKKKKKKRPRSLTIS